ncbi:hypothetical protein J2Z66_001738 [Paenibacillus eucommiae]|uniref:Uncharacterized protein n=1 Tax=Paenibacillus eucommiae TaxID=1355755 RepID=A0ABS4IRH3_9BACL|nr:hypothetical protein [Paenibacillus eucommiae]
MRRLSAIDLESGLYSPAYYFEKIGGLTWYRSKEISEEISKRYVCYF